MPLWLVGMMGAGKSAVGPLVAARTGQRFVDTDQLVEAEAGRTIAEIWEVEAEAGFRRRERAVIMSLAGDGVVATGGGAVLDPGNVESMRRRGIVVWLDARPATLVARLRGGQGRPLFTGSAPEAIIDLINERRPHYLAAAHYRVSTDGRTFDDLAAEIEDLWNRS